MRKIGLALTLVGSGGPLFLALRFTEVYQPMWIRAVKHLPDKPSYTRQDVAAAVQDHIAATRSTLYFGVGFSAAQVVGTLLVYRARTGERKPRSLS